MRDFSRQSLWLLLRITLIDTINNSRNFIFSKKCISQTFDWLIKNDGVFIGPNIQYLFTDSKSCKIRRKSIILGNLDFPAKILSLWSIEIQKVFVSKAAKFCSPAFIQNVWKHSKGEFSYFPAHFLAWCCLQTILVGSEILLKKCTWLMLMVWRRRQPDTFFNFWQHRSNDVVLEIFALAHEGYIRTWREYWSARWRCLLLLWCAGGFIALQIAVTQDAFLIATHTLERLRSTSGQKEQSNTYTEELYY